MTRSARRLTFVAPVLISALLLMFYSNFASFGMNISPIMGVPFTVMFWAAIAGGGIWFAVRVMGVHTGTGIGKRDEAISILRQRYARCEINRTEYFQMKQDLDSGS